MKARISKKASKEIANLINRIQVGTMMRDELKRDGNHEGAKVWMLEICRSEVALADDYGIPVVAVNHAREILAIADAE